MDSTTMLKQFKLFARVSELYKAGAMVLNEQALKDPVEALAQFVSGFAFERQGRSPSYGPIAGDVIRELGRAPGFWEDPDSPKKVWEAFREKLRQLSNSTEPSSKDRSNPKVNPLCYKGFRYMNGQPPTGQPSAIEFAQGLKTHNFNVVVWAKSKLEQDQVRDAYDELLRINGIGPKIASLFLREVAWCFGVTPSRDRTLLQPIDVWVARAVERMDSDVSDKSREEHRKWIIEKSEEAGVLPEAVNASLWYLGAIVAGSEYKLFEVLKDPEQTEQLVDEYVGKLGRQVNVW